MMLTVKQLKRMLAEAAGEPTISVDAAIEELTDARKWMGRMNNMTPFSKWYKGDHKKAMAHLVRAAMKLSKSAAAAGDEALQKAAKDYASEVRGHETDGDAKYVLGDMLAARKGKLSIASECAAMHMFESTGEAGLELVDESSWQHLEVGNVYRWIAGDDAGISEFKGWVGNTGVVSPDEDPRNIDLAFSDVDSDFEWEAYWHEGSYRVGSDADPLYVEEAP